ncbi:MAG TPA: AAA family ATPase, partial [Bacillota bacterium]
MKLTKLEVKGFGRLKDLNLALGDGLNIIHGLNEAGKSTLQRFIQGMLYGLQKPMAQREAKLPELDRYRPWGGGDYRGALEYELKGGGRFRVERDFGAGPLATRIFDAATGKDLTKKFGQDRRHELRFAETHLGLGDGEFTSTCCLPQLGTDQIELAAQIGEKLANLAQAGQEDLSVQRAVKVLAEQVAKIGTDRAPTQPVALKRVEVQRLETLLQAARGQRQALLDEEVRLRSRETQVATLAGAASELEGRVLASRRVRLTTRLEQIRQGEAALAQAAATAERLKPDFDPPDPLVFESAGQSRLAEL